VVQVGDLDPLLLGEIPRADLADFEAVQRLDEPDRDAVAIDGVATGPVSRGAPGDTDLTGRATDTPTLHS
jgi:hypothetical protein